MNKIKYFLLCLGILQSLLISSYNSILIYKEFSLISLGLIVFNLCFVLLLILNFFKIVTQEGNEIDEKT